MDSSFYAVTAGWIALVLKPTPGNPKPSRPRGASVFLRQRYQYYCGLRIGGLLVTMMIVVCLHKPGALAKRMKRLR